MREPLTPAEGEGRPEVDPHLARELKGVTPYTWGMNAARTPILLESECCFHDPHAPEAEAANLVGAGTASLHLHFGFGFGYFADAVPKTPGTRILVYEPDASLCAAAIEAQPGAFVPHVTVRVTFESFRYLALSLAQHGAYRYFASPAHVAQFPEAFERFRLLLEELDTRPVFRGRGYLYPTVLKSTVESLPYHLRCPGFEAWRDRLTGKCAVLIAAGPSLERNIGELLPYRDKIVIFAVARVVAYLEQWGIEPDFLVHLEAQDFASFIEGRSNLERTVFLLAAQTHPAYYRYPARAIHVFQSRFNGLINSLVALDTRFRHELVKSGGNVATAAFFLAFLAGCDPIILIGQDLALSQARDYAGGAQVVTTGLPQVPGYHGGQVATTPNYRTNLIWYERMLPRCLASKPGFRAVNATEGGAHIEGMLSMKLRHALYLYAREAVSISLPQCDPLPNPEHLLQTFLTELSDLLRAFESLTNRLSTDFMTVLDCLSAGKAPPDPQPLLTGYITAIGRAPHFSQLFKAELKSAELLLTPGRADHARQWAGLKTLYDRITEVVVALRDLPENVLPHHISS